MKKMMAVLALAILAMAGCSAQAAGAAEAPAFFQQSFLMTADFTAAGMEGSLTFRKNDGGSYEMRFTAPDSIAGMTLTLNDGTVVTEFLGIRSEQPLEDLSPASPLYAMHYLLTLAPESITAVTSSNGDVVYSYPDGAEMIVYSGVPKRIEIPAADLTLKITGFESITT